MEKEFLIKEIPYDKILDVKVKNINLSIFNLAKYLSYPKGIKGFELLEIKGKDYHFTLLYSDNSCIASSYIGSDTLILNQDALPFFQTSNKEFYINIFNIYNEEILNSILSLYYGEISYRNLDYEIIDISKLFDLLFENKFTGILSFFADRREYVFCNDGKGLIVDRGDVKESFPMNEFINHVPDSLIPLLSNPKTKLSIFSLREDKEIKNLKLNLVEMVPSEVYFIMSEYVKRMCGVKGLKIFEKYFTLGSSKSSYLYHIDDFQREIKRLVGNSLGEVIVNFIEKQLNLI